MKKVDVIFPAYINATIGPTGTLRRLLKNKDYLKKRGYELEIFTYDYLVSGGKVEAVDFTKGLSQRSKVKQYIKRNSFFSMLFVLRRMWKAKLWWKSMLHWEGLRISLFFMKWMPVMLI